MKQYISGVALLLVLLVSHNVQGSEGKEGAEGTGKALIRFKMQSPGNPFVHWKALKLLNGFLTQDTENRDPELFAISNQNQDGPPARFLENVTNVQAVSVVEQYVEDHDMPSFITITPKEMAWLGWRKNVLGICFKKNEEINAIREKLFTIAESKDLSPGRRETRDATLMLYRVHDVPSEATQGRTGLTAEAITAWQALHERKGAEYASNVQELLQSNNYYGPIVLTGLEVSGIDGTVVQSFDFQELDSPDLSS